jgi:hypothetical protein
LGKRQETVRGPRETKKAELSEEVITRYVIRPTAAEDLDEQLDYYETEGGNELALRFFGAVEEAIQFLYRYPDAGSPKEFANVFQTL